MFVVCYSMYLKGAATSAWAQWRDEHPTAPRRSRAADVARSTEKQRKLEDSRKKQTTVEINITVGNFTGRYCHETQKGRGYGKGCQSRLNLIHIPLSLGEGAWFQHHACWGPGAQDLGRMCLGV
jgi:hypothetical protein